MHQHQQSLGPIAEAPDAEASNSAPPSPKLDESQPSSEQQKESLSPNESYDGRRRLSSAHEACVSIDLNSAGDQSNFSCTTPTSASASIDIRDYHGFVSYPTQFAAVLHPARNQQQPAQNDAKLTNHNGQQPEQEAAAVRIQSAFRGYRARKSSPYRTRSLRAPGNRSTSDNQHQEQQNDENQAPASLRLVQNGSGGSFDNDDSSDQQRELRLSTGRDNAAFEIGDEDVSVGAALVSINDSDLELGATETANWIPKQWDDGSTVAESSTSAAVTATAPDIELSSAEQNQPTQQPISLQCQTADTVDDVTSEALDSGAALTGELASDDLERLDPLGAGAQIETPVQVSADYQSSDNNDDEVEDDEENSSLEGNGRALDTNQDNSLVSSDVKPKEQTATNDTGNKKKRNRNKRRGKK